MEPQKISPLIHIGDRHDNSIHIGQKNNIAFKSFLNADSPAPVDNDSLAAGQAFFLPPSAPAPLEPTLKIASNMEAITAYKKQDDQSARLNKISDWEKYRDDQLLSNPGGDHYYLEQNKVVSHPDDQESFWGRLKKDFSDAFSNVKNFFQNLLFGSKIRYRDKNNQIQEAKQRGLIGSVIDFFKDLGSALSFGAWRPDGEAEPKGFLKRCGFFFSKMKEAIFGDLIQGVTGSIVHMGEDLIFAGWNLVESIPDATIGNLKEGKKLTTAIFDNGQVALDYLTDILPSGDAWLRVHSPDLKKLSPPILNNINMPEHSTEDVRWKYVRNTPFRKTIETIGSLLIDVLTLKIFGHTKLFSEKQNHRN